jgi:hypothetical protein
MFNSFSQIVSFQILNDKNDPSKSYSYNSDDKKNQCISIDLERKFKDVNIRLLDSLFNCSSQNLYAYFFEKFYVLVFNFLLNRYVLS